LADKFVIEGGWPLAGEIRPSGAKNSVLKLIAASLLSDQPLALSNVPQLSDVRVMADVVRQLGCTVTHEDDRLILDANHISSVMAPYELVTKMRASFNVLGALLGRMGEAKVSLPGGCSIGKRGVDLHVKGLQALGADVQIVHGYVEAKATKLVGSDILLDIPSVGATENIMLAAVLAEGVTTISNAAQEPEIIDLANFLNELGADIHDAGTHVITIHGVKKLHGGSYSVVPDRIEAATFLMAAAATRGSVVVNGVVPSHLTAVTHKLQEMGVNVEMIGPNALQVTPPERLIAQNLVTQPYPGFPTDLQAPMMPLLAIADGVSVVTETIYENRFKHVGELKRMGAQIQTEGNVAIVTGVERLAGAPVKASDLRAGAAMVIAGLMADGQTEIYELQHLDRGYECLAEKLASLGAHIQRVEVESTVVDVI
jgi:UDP-N-acetylglucosamine 1-carboxyvinyltransferase